MVSMKCFDAHIHSEGRSSEDLEFMASEGVKRAITCAFYPIIPKHQGTLIDHFRKLITFEKERGARAGMEIYPAIGVHPRCIPPQFDKILEFMEKDEESIAFGEIGLERGGKIEKDVLIIQLKIAEKLDKPCIIHTPKNNKLEMTKEIIKVLEDLNFPMERVILDHATPETVEIILKRGYHAGLTVEEGKITPEDVVRIVKEYGTKNLIINSDTGFAPSMKIAVAQTTRILLENFNEKTVSKLVWDNANKFFEIP